MNLHQIKEELESKFEKYLYKIDRLPLKPLDKICTVNTYVYSKIKWEFSIYKLSTTWAKQHLDNILTCRIRHWLNLHPGSNISHLKQPTSKPGINLSFPSDVFLSYQTTTRGILSLSKDPDVLKIYNDTKKFNIDTGTTIKRANGSTNKNKKQICKKIIKQENKDKSWCHFINLKKENIITTFLINNTPINRLSSWHKVSLKLPSNIYNNICRKYLILALPTKANLRTWNIIENSTCDLCKRKSET